MLLARLLDSELINWRCSFDIVNYTNARSCCLWGGSILRNKERDPLLHLFNVAPVVLGLFSYWSMYIITTHVAYSCLLVSFGLFLAPYTKLAFVPVVMATIILIGVIL